MRQTREEKYKLTDKERQIMKEINEYLKRNFTPSLDGKQKMQKLIDSIKSVFHHDFISPQAFELLLFAYAQRQQLLSPINVRKIISKYLELLGLMSVKAHRSFCM